MVGVVIAIPALSSPSVAIAALALGIMTALVSLTSTSAAPGWRIKWVDLSFISSVIHQEPRHLHELLLETRPHKLERTPLPRVLSFRCTRYRLPRASYKRDIPSFALIRCRSPFGHQLVEYCHTEIAFGLQLGRVCMCTSARRGGRDFEHFCNSCFLEIRSRHHT
jgi:hypothetical protein